MDVGYGERLGAPGGRGRPRSIRGQVCPRSLLPTASFANLRVGGSGSQRHGTDNFAVRALDEPPIGAHQQVYVLYEFERRAVEQFYGAGAASLPVPGLQGVLRALGIVPIDSVQQSIGQGWAGAEDMPAGESVAPMDLAGFRFQALERPAGVPDGKTLSDAG